ncbi:uncharacterized protein LOC108337420 isoform X2 [Vigna angularis]|uniref:uncharacterized protein LOC108337420 isoform X2 n=1 Tax=Phaseolus angularis TaxID=3914 RepID=UPI00080A03AB|nr:uncharacterized protein LOC108337420 isoform X2 [Vigna angularis]
MSLSPSTFNLKVSGIPTNTDVARVMTCLFEKDVEFRHIPGSIGRKFAVVQEIGKIDACYDVVEEITLEQELEDTKVAE